MESRLADALESFYREDPDAYGDKDFTKDTDNAEEVGRRYVDFLQHQARGLTAPDPWGLVELLIELLESSEMYEEELEQIGRAILESKNR